MNQNNQVSQKSRLLVVDDNEINRELLRVRLEMKGYVVSCATGGRQALEMAFSENFDLILLDIMMPEVGGMDVLKVLREKRTVADLPVIMATALEESESILEALSLGANDYVTKPIDFPVLMARIETHLKLKRLSRQKDEFLAIASHDLKNPLSIVKGFARMVKMTCPPGTVMTEQGDKMIGSIIGATQRMENIISDFLDFEAIENGQISLSRRPMDLAAAIRSTVETQAGNSEARGIRIETRIEEPLAGVSADENRIMQVLQNLIGNALKFCPKGSTVIVSARNSDNSVLVEVADDGPGITAREQTQLFVKYSRLKHEAAAGEKSSGLGLAICKQLIELHGGQIGVRSLAPEQKGATFWFKLPLD